MICYCGDCCTSSYVLSLIPYVGVLQECDECTDGACVACVEGETCDHCGDIGRCPACLGSGVMVI